MENDKYKFLKQKIVELLAIVNELHVKFEGRRKFTLDGRLIGDIGEIIADLFYDLEIDKVSRPGYDAVSCGREVQIKATMKDFLTFKNCEGYYLGLKINSDGTYKEIYNGPASIIMERYKQRKYIGEKLISIKNGELLELSKNIPKSEKIKEKIV